MKAIYHAPFESYEILKDRGFTHCEVSMTAYPGNQADMARCIKELHRLEMGAIIAPFNHQEPYDNSGMLWKNEFNPKTDILYLPDEPNKETSKRDKINPDYVKALSYLSWMPTMVCLTDIRSVLGYENCADYIGLDSYEKLTWSRKLRLGLKILWLKAVSRKRLVAICPVRESIEFTQSYIDFWSKFGVKDFYFYSYTPEQDGWTGDAIQILGGIKLCQNL